MRDFCERIMSGKIYLALETSCDETAASLVEDGRKLICSKLVSQISVHQAFGGVVPEVAARRHVETINDVIDEALSESGVRPQDIHAVACTAAGIDWDIACRSICG